MYLGFILLIASWILRTYGAIIENRNALNTPLFWSSEINKTLLAITWIVLLMIGLYRVYVSQGLLALAISLIVYFLVAPALLSIFSTTDKRKKIKHSIN